MKRVHLDTDLGGDPDDACALAMLLGWQGVEITGVTTTIDPGGRRAGYVAHCLELAGRADIPVEAGAERSLTTGRLANPYTDERFWSTAISPRPSPEGAALELLSRSIAAGATVIGIGPYTNLALLELAQPGSLGKTPVVVMGGWVDPPAAGLPAWGPEMDWNVQWDSDAAETVFDAATDLTLATLPVTMSAQLRAADLPVLRGMGALGELLANQSEAHAEHTEMAQLAASNPGLPEDLLNFHYDPVTCAVALGWPGTAVERMHLEAVRDTGILRFLPSEDGRPTKVVVSVDGPSFTNTWLAAVRAATRASTHSKEFSEESAGV